MRLMLWRTALRTALLWLVLALVLPPTAPAQAGRTSQAGVSLLLFASVAEAQPGQTFSYSISITGAATATVTLRDVLNPALVLTNLSTTTGMTCQTGPTIVCSLAPGDALFGQ